MSPAERFVRFAAECDRMAKFTHIPENKTEWTRMAARWRLYADFYDQQTSAVRRGTSTKRHRAPAHSWSH